MESNDIITPEEEIVSQLKKLCKTVTFAESLTGGMTASRLVSVSGASEVFGYGFVTYADRAKHEMLGVSDECLKMYGAVSGECACEMAKGARVKASSDYAVSLTGFAGPYSGEENHPVGTVFIGYSDSKETISEEYHFEGNRASIREQASENALMLLRDKLNR